MAKTANLYARIEPDVKEKAESILNSLGISASSAINMFYKQIILHRGIPFDLKLPATPVPNIDELTKEELHRALEEAHNDIEAGRTQAADEVFAELRKEYGL